MASRLSLLWMLALRVQDENNGQWTKETGLFEKHAIC